LCRLCDVIMVSVNAARTGDSVPGNLCTFN